MSKIRVGQSELNRLMSKGDAITPEPGKLREEEATLAGQPDELAKRLVVLDRKRTQQNEDDNRFDLVYERDDVAGKLEKLRAKIDTSQLRIANAVWGG
jgi:hypothetical protein